jgi:phosphate butyryltransferase
MIKNFDQLMDEAKKRGPKTLAVAVAQDQDVMLAVENARKYGIVNAILVGDNLKISQIAKEENIDLNNYEIIHIEDLKEASLKAVELVSSGKAHLVMKGLVDTSIILKAVLDKEVGLKTGNVLSHVAVFDTPMYHKMLLVTDAAMNIKPDLDQKKQIIENALFVSRALDIEEAKVGVICAKEKVEPKMEATVHAGELVKMNQDGILKGCLVGGPFALDNAVSKEAAKIKKIDHPAAGDIDIALMADIDSGNVLYKALNFLTKSKSAGVIVGAKAPVVLTSRADSDESKLYSIALGVLMASK